MMPTNKRHTTHMPLIKAHPFQIVADTVTDEDEAQLTVRFRHSPEESFTAPLAWPGRLRGPRLGDAAAARVLPGAR